MGLLLALVLLLPTALALLWAWRNARRERASYRQDIATTPRSQREPAEFIDRLTPPPPPPRHATPREGETRPDSERPPPLPYRKGLISRPSVEYGAEGVDLNGNHFRTYHSVGMLQQTYPLEYIEAASPAERCPDLPAECYPADAVELPCVVNDTTPCDAGPTD